MSKAKSILLIEDNEDDIYTFKRVLGRSEIDWHILDAPSGEVGIDLLKNVAPDVVLLDYSLPGSDGLDILMRIKQLAPTIPVIMLTGQGNEKIAATSIKCGAADYITKDEVNDTSLAKAINNAISLARLHKKIAVQQDELEHFSYVLAHDLKQPAKSIDLMAQLILQKFEGQMPAEAHHKLGLLKDTAEQMNELINALVSYTKLDLNKPNIELTDFNRSLKLTLNTLSETIKTKNAMIESQELPHSMAISSFVTQLFQILISNALLYNIKTPHISIKAKQTEKHWFFTVSDNGIGISQEDQEKVFEPLVRLHEQTIYKGSGLGLATAKRIIAKHKGEIYCLSNSQGGIDIHFSIAKYLEPTSKTISPASDKPTTVAL